ncbi:Centrosomal protein of 44 kDa [Terramyces sp. JEL0728]|nr:Centrosomal protein of 44 kDa [Terramyces sp. JEL0728]
MATGDLKNNIAILESELKAIKYNGPFSVSGISKGDPVCFLPMFHFVFLAYSPLLATHFSELSYDLYGKRDKRFVEAIYSALRDVFNYKPKISRDQFFSKGFAERKCILVTDTIKFAKVKRQELLRLNKDKQRLPVKQISASRDIPQITAGAAVRDPAPHPNEINESFSVDDSLMDIPKEKLEPIEFDFKDSFSYNPLREKTPASPSPGLKERNYSEQFTLNEQKPRTISADLSFRSITPIMDVHQNEIVPSWTNGSRTPMYDDYESKAVYPEIISHIPRCKSNSPTKSSMKSSPSKRTVLFHETEEENKMETEKVLQLEKSLQESNKQQKILVLELETVRAKVAELESAFKLLQGLLLPKEDVQLTATPKATPHVTSNISPIVIPQPAITPVSDTSVNSRKHYLLSKSQPEMKAIPREMTLVQQTIQSETKTEALATNVNLYDNQISRYTPLDDTALRQSVIRKTSTPDLRVSTVNLRILRNT